MTKEEFEDMKDFVKDIIAINNKYYDPFSNFPEDFDNVMEKWSEKIEHYKWNCKKEEE